MMATTIFMGANSFDRLRYQSSSGFDHNLLHRSMEYWYFLMYKRVASCVGRANIKNGAASLGEPRRPGIAPTGELAGLPARDAPKSSEVSGLARSRARPLRSSPVLV